MKNKLSENNIAENFQIRNFFEDFLNFSKNLVFFWKKRAAVYDIQERAFSKASFKPSK